MEPIQVAEQLKERFQDDVLSVSEYCGQTSVVVRKQQVREVCRYLHDEPGLGFRHLRDLCGVDYFGKRTVRFEVVYHLYSLTLNEMIRLKAPVPEDHCTVPSVAPVWSTADWHERECFDLFGIVFEDHPDLRRILLPDDWTGHPLRKDYPIAGPAPEDDWPGYREVLKKSEEFKTFEWNR